MPEDEVNHLQKSSDKLQGSEIYLQKGIREQIIAYTVHGGQ